MVRTKINSQNLIQLKRHLREHCSSCSLPGAGCPAESQLGGLEVPIGRSPKRVEIELYGHKRERYRQNLKLLSLATVSLLLLSNHKLRSPTRLVFGQEIAEVSARDQHLAAADDDELSKTLDRPGDEENRSSSISLQLGPSTRPTDGELDERNREHSMSIWSPDEHHRLSSQEDLDQIAVQKQLQHDDEEMVGATELTHHFISVLNNQSNIVFPSNPTTSDGNNTSADQQLKQQHQPFATTFLLGNDPSNDTRTVLSVNWKQITNHQSNGNRQQNTPEPISSHSEPGDKESQHHEPPADSISNKADQQSSTPVQTKQEFRKKKRKKKVHKKIIIGTENHPLGFTVSPLPQLMASTTPQTGPARMISYRPKGISESTSQTPKVPALMNSSRLWPNENQSPAVRQQIQVSTQPTGRYQQHAPGKTVSARDSLAALGSNASGRLIVPGARLAQQPLISTSDLLTQMSYLDPSTTSSSNIQTGSVSTVAPLQSPSSSPFEFKKLAKGNDYGKQLVVNDYLIASSSHPANEFETTLKQQPQHQQEPIITHSDTGSSSALDTQGGLESTSSSSILTPSDLNDEDDGDGDLEPFELANSGEPTSTGLVKGGSSSSGDRDEKQFSSGQVGDKSLKQQTGANKHQVTNNQPRKKANEVELDTHKDTSGSGAQQSLSSGQTRIAPEPEPIPAELLLGPFLSEFEAPTTIKYKNTVYQKSGSSSTLLESGSPPAGGQDSGAGGFEQQDKLPVSGLSPPGGRKISNNSQTLTGLKSIEQLVRSPQTDKYVSGWLQSQPAPAQLSASINDILMNFVKNSQQEQPLNSASAGHLDSSSSALNQLTEQPSYLAGGESGTIRLAAFGPLSGASSLLSNSIISNSGANQLQAAQLDDLLLGVNSAPKLVSLNQLKGAPKDYSALDLTNSIGSASSLAPEQVWTAAKKGEKFYLGGALSAAASDSHHHHHSAHKDKGPIVIVQKDVKPVKYHLMRAYLKLRRLLRPFEATYVFLNDQQTTGYSAKRRHRRSGGSRPQLEPSPSPPPSTVLGQSKPAHIQVQQSAQSLLQMPMPNAVTSSSS